MTDSIYHSDMQILYDEIVVSVAGVPTRLATAYCLGSTAPIIFLHGFGSSKEDFLDVIHQSILGGQSFLAYDAPGCGESSCDDLSRVTIPFLVQTAEAILKHFNIRSFHLVGHSMGGLTSLILARQNQERVLSFINIEGNVAPEDCFLSRQVITHPTANSRTFLDDFVQRTRQMPFFSSALYAANVRYKVRSDVVHGIFESMVELSDNVDLMSHFLSLPCQRMFMYGDQNSSLSYLPHLEAQGVKLAEISSSGHWPMYSNPVMMWQRIGSFIMPNLAHTDTCIRTTLEE